MLPKKDQEHQHSTFVVDVIHVIVCEKPSNSKPHERRETEEKKKIFFCLDFEPSAILVHAYRVFIFLLLLIFKFFFLLLFISDDMTGLVVRILHLFFSVDLISLSVSAELVLI